VLIYKQVQPHPEPGMPLTDLINWVVNLAYTYN